MLPGFAPAAVLFDRVSNLMRAAGPVLLLPPVVQANLEHRLPGGNLVRLSYASGDALVMPALPQASALTDVLASAHSRHAQTYAISFSGTLDGTGTRWRASYSWQPEDTVTAVRPSRRTLPSPT